MKHSSTAWLVIAVVVLAGCASTQNRPAKHTFHFDHEGEPYEIVSTVTSTGEGYNYLISREDGQIVVSVRDDDQDGTLDRIVVGDLSLAKTNSIYDAGVREAIDREHYVENLNARIFTMDDEEARYVVGTYVATGGVTYNKFYVYGEEVELVAIDEDADGTLDRFEEGSGELSAAQALYERVLDDGVRRGRVSVTDGQYVVERRRPSPSSQVPVRMEPM